MIRDTHLPARSTIRREGFGQHPDPVFPVREVGVLDLVRLRWLSSRAGTTRKLR